MFRGEHGKPFFQKGALEISVMGDDEHYPVEQIVHGSVINSATSEHLIGNAGDLRDLGWD